MADSVPAGADVARTSEPCPTERPQGAEPAPALLYEARGLHGLVAEFLDTLEMRVA